MLTEQLSRLLSHDERMAVCGDLLEVRASGRRALAATAALVARRHVALWADWRSWLALVGIAVPIGLLLSVASSYVARGSAVYAWLYVNNWTWGYVASPGARLELAGHLRDFLLFALAFAVCAGSGGYALASLARRTTWFTGTALCAIVVGRALATEWSWMWSAPASHEASAAVFSLAFYRLAYPWLLRTALVLLPAVLGMRLALSRTIVPLLPAILVAVAAGLLILSLGSQFMFASLGVSRLEPGPDGVFGTSDDPRPLLVPLVLMWPSMLIAAQAIWSRARAAFVS